MQNDGQTDMTKLTVAFRNFAKAPEKDEMKPCYGLGDYLLASGG
jgi:hypothetical protein